MCLSILKCMMHRTSLIFDGANSLKIPHLKGGDFYLKYHLLSAKGLLFWKSDPLWLKKLASLLHLCRRPLEVFQVVLRKWVIGGVKVEDWFFHFFLKFLKNEKWPPLLTFRSKRGWLLRQRGFFGFKSHPLSLKGVLVLKCHLLFFSFFVGKWGKFQSKGALLVLKVTPFDSKGVTLSTFHLT